MSAGVIGFIIGAVAGGAIGAVAMGVVAGGSDTAAEDVATAYAIGYGDGIRGRRPHPEYAARITGAAANKDNETGWRVC